MYTKDILRLIGEALGHLAAAHDRLVEVGSSQAITDICDDTINSLTRAYVKVGEALLAVMQEERKQ